MANFCGFCGKLLQEGEVCTCQQQNAQQMSNQMQGQQPMQQNQAFGQTQQNQAPDQQGQYYGYYGQQPGQNNMGNMPYQGMPYQGMPNQGMPYRASSGQMANQCRNLFQNIVDLFKNPVGTTRKIAEENTLMVPLSMVIANIVGIFLIAVIAMIAVRLKVGDYSGWISIPYARIVLVATMLSAMFDFALAGCLLLSTKVFFREETSFAKMLAVVGARVILDTIVIAVGAIFMILSAAFGILIIIVGMMFTSIVFIQSFYAVSALSETKRVYALFVATVMQVVAMTIVYAILSVSLLASVANAFDYLF